MQQYGKGREKLLYNSYRKIPKNSDTQKIAVIILKIEQFSPTIE